MHTLTREERQTLIAMIGETHGLGLDRDAFVDAMLGLFEDIPGFETIPPAKARRIVHQLWSKYHGKEVHHKA